MLAEKRGTLLAIVGEIYPIGNIILNMFIFLSKSYKPHFINSDTPGWINGNAFLEYKEKFRCKKARHPLILILESNIAHLCPSHRFGQNKSHYPAVHPHLVHHTDWSSLIAWSMNISKHKWRIGLVLGWEKIQESQCQYATSRQLLDWLCPERSLKKISLSPSEGEVFGLSMRIFLLMLI